jgi:hypothetical protein
MGRRRNSSSDSSGGVFFLAVIILGLIIKFIWWIIAGLALVAAFHLVRALVRADRGRRAAYAARCAQITARADQQHDWVLQGDARGTYGPEGVSVMRDVFGRKEIPPFGVPYDL